MNTEGIDYRKDTPPTDWLSKRLEKLQAIRPNPPSNKDLGLEFLIDLQEELDTLRCQDPCPTQNGADPTAAAAQPCICGLIARISDLSGEWVPKDEFVAVLQPFGYTKDKALQKYSTYALEKIQNKYIDEYDRLEREGDNAYNWKWEVGFDAGGALTEVLAELDELQARCKAELAEIMAE